MGHFQLRADTWIVHIKYLVIITYVYGCFIVSSKQEMIKSLIYSFKNGP